MNEEEKKAIETLKEVASDDFDTLGDDISPKMAQNILNLIDKQQRQIETIKEENSKLIYKNVDMSYKQQQIIIKKQKEIEGKNAVIDTYKHTEKVLKEEIEEKTTIIMAGAEKVKQLEKEIQRLEKDNDTLSELVIVNEDKVIKELDLISKDKIREKIKDYTEKSKHPLVNSQSRSEYTFALKVLKELLEEN